MFLLITLFCLVYSVSSSSYPPCVAHSDSVRFESVVCVCNSTYCDYAEPVGSLPSDAAVVYESNRAGLRLRKSLLKFDANGLENDPRSVQITVNTDVTYQEIRGFGGAFTDAAGINIASLSRNAQKQLIRSYYGLEGIEYTIGRIPMASCDFSTHEYSYDDSPGDFSLKNFKLTKEDTNYKIPFIKDAISMSPTKIYLFGSPWSAPAWMKTGNSMHGNGTLKGTPGDKYYQTWAKYFVKFLQGYQTQNITVSGITAQNEPTTGYMIDYTFQTMGFTPETQRDFIKLNLGPELHSNGFENVELMILDDQRIMLPQWADIVLKDPIASGYVSGIALHWYENFLSFPGVLSVTQQRHPTKFILATEACTGALPWEKRGVDLGNWNRANKYAKDIIDDLNHFVSGWTDWNLALDLGGGPNWANNVVDSPIIVDKWKDQFYKQPMFYALGHFSKFVRPGYKRIEQTVLNGRWGIKSATFSGQDGRKVIVILNELFDSAKVDVVDKKTNKKLAVVMKPQSIATIIWK